MKAVGMQVPGKGTGAPPNGHCPHLQQGPSSPDPRAEASPTPPAGCGLGTAQGSLRTAVGSGWAPSRGRRGCSSAGVGMAHPREVRWLARGWHIGKGVYPGWQTGALELPTMVWGP